MKALWLERILKRLNEPRVLAVAIAVAILVVSLGTIYALYNLNRSLQFPFPDMGADTFFVTSNKTDWKATFEVVDNSSWHMPRSWTSYTNVYITVFKPDGTLGLATKRFSEMTPGQSYNGVRLIDLGDLGHLDNGDYVTFARDIYPAGTQVTVEGHGSGWNWSMGFGLQAWFESGAAQILNPRAFI